MVTLHALLVRRPDLTVATADHNVPTADIDKPVEDPISAKQLEVLAASPWTITGAKPREGVAHMTLASAPSGALIFATGSMQWAWGLDDFNAPALRPSRLNAAAERVTRNLLARFTA